MAVPISNGPSAGGNGLSPRFAVVTILKGMIGAGILSLPHVFGKVGLRLAVPGYLLISVICAFSIWRLIECKALLAARCLLQEDEQDSLSEKNGAEEVKDCGLGPLGSVSVQVLGPAGLVIAGFGIIASQLGFGIAYIDIVVETMSSDNLLGSSFSTVWLRVIVGLILCLLSCIRSLNGLAKISAVALVIYSYLIIALIRQGGTEVVQGTAPDLAVVWGKVQWDNIGLWLGTAIFAQEAIVISQYVFDDMKLANHRDFLPVLIWSFSICGTLCSLVGALGYMCYGDDVKSVFYLNFPRDSRDVCIAETVLCVVLLASFGLQMYPVVSFLEAVFVGKAGETESEESEEELSESDKPSSGGGFFRAFLLPVALRWSLVVLCSAVAVSIPDLSCVTGYSGSFAVSTIGFFLPALCHMKLNSFQLSPLDWALDIMLLLLGIASVILGIEATHCGGDTVKIIQVITKAA
ncbi:unnamed protein product [Polarella glacialis]|uniref:Amino acid transporter transmembrane domain-containing protein n=1 Tax=Polarella glacialis TaxID=89957 RepID=A0A813FHY9_POLGL|nr:unnamed protein product [Polarella glacialis]CAE8735219.1 unnamed protein product [Polarella glacialis]